MISIDDLKKIELKVAKVISAERVAGSEKLLKLTVDLGEVKRQIVAGIAKSYQPEELVDKEIIVVANLEPRIFMGIESQGMVLAANDRNGPILIMPEKETNPGTELR